MVILRQRMRARSDKSDEVLAALAEIIPSAGAASERGGERPWVLMPLNTASAEDVT
jgi:hypothetical protein